MKKHLFAMLLVLALLLNVVACTDDPSTTGTTTAEPDAGTTTAAPDTGDDDPDAGTTTTAAPDTGDDDPDAGTTTTVAPDTGDDDPDAGTTTTAAPGGGEDDPDAGTTTTAAPGGGEDDPDAGTTTTAAPDGGNNDPVTKYTVTFVSKDGTELQKTEVEEGATLPAPTANTPVLANLTATAWKDAEGNLYFWNLHAKTDTVKGWVNAAGEPVEFKVTKNLTLTQWSDMVDITTVDGYITSNAGIVQLSSFQNITYNLGAWDLSKYAAVKITYGAGETKESSYAGKYVLLLADTNKAGTPVASVEMILPKGSYAQGPATVTLDLLSVTENYENLYLACTMGTNHHAGCYRIEFIYKTATQDTTHTVTFKDKDGSTAATQTVAQGVALPAPPVNVRGVINMGATGWKDSKGNLYFWNYFATSDSVIGWVDASGEPVDFKVTGDVTLTAWSDVVDLATVTGNTTATNGTFQLQNLHQNVYDLGAWDLSLYSAVKVTYGRDASVANGGVLKFLADNSASATPIATTTLIQTPASWMTGATTVTVDLSAVNGLYEHLYLTLQSSASTGCYRMEFIYKGDAPSVTHTVTYLNRDGSTLATQTVARGTTVPAPTAVWQGIANRASTCWKDAEGNLYFWNNHVASDGVSGWTNAAGEAVAFKVMGNVTLTASSQVVDLENIPGEANRPDGTPQLANIQSNVYDLGAWDLSKYAAVKITYGRDASVTGGTLYLHAKADGSAPPVASAAMTQVSAGYAAGPATVTMDLSAVNRAYEHLYLTVSGSNHSTGCYRIEFIEWDKGEEPPVVENPTTGPITDEFLHQTVTEGYERFQHYHLSSALGEGYVTLTATEDIAWISPAVSIPTAPVLAIKYRTHYSQAASVCLQAGEHFDEHYFYWVGDGEWHLLTLELSDALTQEEVINGLHLTLAGQATVEVDIQYIAFFDTEDAAKTYDTAAGTPTASDDIQIMPDFKVSGVFGSHMVLQRNQPIRVWGFSNSEGSTVTGTFAGETVTAQVTPEGTWMLTFSAQSANKVGQTMTISDDRDHTATLEDILIGDVWLIGGQSNAEMSISRSEIPADLVFDESDPIRLFRQNQHYAASSGAALLRPQKDILLSTWGWNTANESAAKAFSAIGYYFAKEVAKQTDVPQGMIMIAADGGRLQEFYPAWVAHELGYTKGAIVCEGGYYNTLIAPFEGLSFKGMLFFQGEAESLAENTALTYEERFAGLIATQRECFGFDFPLYFVQLSSYTGFPYHHVVRMQQFEASKSIPNATMVVSMDKGAPNGYQDWPHSPYKYEIGCRLALAALCKEYGIGEASHALSPMPAAATVSEDGTKITLTFANVGDGLTAYGLTPEASIGQSAAGFSVTTEAGTVQTTARILSASTVEIDVPDGLTPDSVDYAYFIGITTDNASLYNSEALPAAAFSLTLPTAAGN